mgnify:CR=1 FL=1
MRGEKAKAAAARAWRSDKKLYLALGVVGAFLLALRLVMRYVERLIATMAQTLLVGDVAADPLMHNLNACAWCPYTAVCGSERAEENAARVSMKNDEVLARMEMQVEGGKTDGGTMD